MRDRFLHRTKKSIFVLWSAVRAVCLSVTRVTLYISGTCVGKLYTQSCVRSARNQCEERMEFSRAFPLLASDLHWLCKNFVLVTSVY